MPCLGFHVSSGEGRVSGLGFHGLRISSITGTGRFRVSRPLGSGYRVCAGK